VPLLIACNLKVCAPVQYVPLLIASRLHPLIGGSVSNDTVHGTCVKREKKPRW
jgi:hypothetical protein